MRSTTQKPYLRWIIGLALGALFIYLALRDVPLQEAIALLAQAKPGWIALALLGVALNNFAKMWRWQVLLAERSLNVTFRLGLRAILAGQMFNYILPARSGDISRAYLVGIRGTGTVYALGTIALEKVLDTLLYGMLFVLTALFFPLPGWLHKSGMTLLAAAGMLLLATLLVERYSGSVLNLGMRIAAWLPPPLQFRIEPRLHDAIQTLGVIRNGRTLISLTFWSIFIWFTAVLPNWALLQSLSLPGGWLAAMTVLLVLQAAISLPGVPGRVGVFQYACIVALGLFGAGESDAFAYGVLLQTVTVLPIILGGVVSLNGMTWKPQKERNKR
ncbi:MAG TPA: flippase-like domain-containing protein [Anaerolineales bacterium]|nr:flippase-like domain-containing protein [Anaerolineales bacterium]